MWYILFRLLIASIKVPYKDNSPECHGVGRRVLFKAPVSGRGVTPPYDFRRGLDGRCNKEISVDGVFLVLLFGDC